MSSILKLSKDMRDVLDVLCDNNGSLSGDDLKRILGWNDSQLTLTVKKMIGNHPDGKRLINAPMRFTSRTTQEFVISATLDSDGYKYCREGRPSSL